MLQSRCTYFGIAQPAFSSIHCTSHMSPWATEWFFYKDMCDRQARVSGCSLEEEDEADHNEQQNDQNLQEESSQNSVLIIGVGVRVWPGLQSQLCSLTLLPAFGALPMSASWPLGCIQMFSSSGGLH